MRSHRHKFSIKLTVTTAVFLCGLLFTARPLKAQPICPLDTLTPKKVASLDAFKEIPVLNYGRIKPIESFAKSFLLQLSSRSRYQEESAIEWFARFLFAPRTTYNDKIFVINNPEILEAIKIEPDKKRRYTYKQLEQGYDKIKTLAEVVQKIDDKERSVVEQEILRVYSNLLLYMRLSGAFAYGFPHPDFTIESKNIINRLNLTDGQTQYSFYDMYARTDLLQEIAEPLARKNKSDWTQDENIIARLINALYFWTEHYQNCPLGLIPTHSHDDEHWLSPMDIIRLNADVPSYNEEIRHIRNMVVHYWNNEQLEFDLSARAFTQSVNERLSSEEKRAVQKIPLELAYNHLNPLGWSKLLYILGFLALLVSLLKDSKLLYRLILTTTAAGFMLHLLAMVLRILILSRPPVSNLYETFVFVGLISVLLGAILEWANKNWLGLFVANIGGFIFLMIAGKFSSDGDTMQMLVAVLNSNFWLSTHVISITMGYAGCCVAGIVGHIYILQALTQPENTQRLDNTLSNLLGILGFGLTMTFFGTALGGIWADQSWGRFWGWDPKENGALLIVLWSAAIFHARLGKMINPLGVAAGCVLGLIVVMWAWFGVNLLSIGLHSYGFTSGVANSLVIYVIAELVFLAIATAILGKKGIKI